MPEAGLVPSEPGIPRLNLRRDLPYALGRFATVRATYGRLIRSAQALGATPGLKPHRGPSIFPEVSVDEVAAALEREAAYIGLRLPAPITADLFTHASRAECLDWATGEVFRPAGDLGAGALTDGRPVIIADVLDSGLCPAALRVALDPLLVAAISCHLRYTPVGVDVRMLLSFPSTAGLEDRRAAGQTVEFHFDVHSYNFVYANFYVTDVDENAGAHEMVLGSHREKPHRWLWGRARRSDAEIRQVYPASSFRTIMGPAGTGFVQDSSCYHRGTPPRTRTRVMLHLRYY